MSNTVIYENNKEKIITVGGVNADICAFDSKAVQLAVDALKKFGGGTVRLNEGVFEIMAPIKLYDNINLTGAGGRTILRKVEGVKTNFVLDADYGELMVTVKDTSGFKTGMGIKIDDSASDYYNVSTAVITAIEGNVIFFDNYLVKNYEAEKDGRVTSACSIIDVVEARNIKISDLAIEGNKETNEYIDGCRGGAIYIFKSKNCTVENVKISGFNGDGISWQITEDIIIRGCEVSGCANYGAHPGTGTLRTVMEECDVHDNGSDGLFVCWRVQYGHFRNNKLHNNGYNGINIGHKDSDNCFESNHIYENDSSGILIREESAGNAANRNVYRKNVIENNGNGEEGYGILFDSYSEGNVIEDNVIRDTGRNVQKYGIMINSETLNLCIRSNLISGHTKGDIEDKSKRVL